MKNTLTGKIKEEESFSNTRLFLEPSLDLKMISNQFTISVKKAFEKDPVSTLNFIHFRQSLISELIRLTKQQLPKSWVKIRDEYLPLWREQSLFLTVNDFWGKCMIVFKDQPKLLEDYISVPIGLLIYLNECGEIVWFQHNPVLSERIYLSADKLTSKLYEILPLKIRDNQGIFTLFELAEEDRFEIKEYLKILIEYELIFKDSTASDTYIIPQYLPENSSTRYFQPLVRIAYAIRFKNYMPRSLVTRFLVKYANVKGSYYWRYGAFFQKESFHLFVLIDINTQTIYLHINDGLINRAKYTILHEIFRFFTMPNSYKGEKLLNIEETRRFEQISLSDEEKKTIQLSSDGEEFATIADIENALQNKIKKVKSVMGNYINISPIMHQLLIKGANTPKKIFLSYAHIDEKYKKELDTHFSALKRSGLIEIWQDRAIMPGEDWDEDIKAAIKQSDIVLLMLSPDFMASDYIWNTELPMAKEYGTDIIPLFIRPCDFEETQFSVYKQQGLPGYENAKTRWIVSSDFPNRDEGYLKIVEGVKSKLKNF